MIEKLKSQAALNSFSGFSPSCSSREIVNSSVLSHADRSSDVGGLCLN